MQKTYIVYCVLCNKTTNEDQYTTLVLTGTEAACVKYLQHNVEDATYTTEEGTQATALELGEGSMHEYLAHVREYMEAVGGSNLWQITCDGIRLEQFVNDYEWHDTWELEGEGNYQTLIINVSTINV